jgi:hypothetical protein
MNFGKGWNGIGILKKTLYWHWSPNYGWEMNFKLEGYNECLITYVMAVSSPTSNSCGLSQGWARMEQLLASQYGIPVILIIMELQEM